jgi:hypothetical protein
MRAFALMLLAAVAAAGCDANRDLPVRPQPTDQPLAAVGTDLTGDLDALLAEMSRHIDAVPSAAPPSISRVRVIEWAKFTNGTETNARDFARFRADFQRTMRRLGDRHDMMFTTSGRTAGFNAYELHATVVQLPDESDQWLVQMALIGPQRDGGRGVVWSDSVATASP